jgi:hypothetical protein
MKVIKEDPIDFIVMVGHLVVLLPTGLLILVVLLLMLSNSDNWNTFSDHRIKENIVKADLKTCYDNVKNINLYRFNYINSFRTASQDKNKLGYIAQEVKRHFPKATNRKKERLTDNREIPDLLSIDTEQINISLYGAVKQLIKIVEKQR